MKKENPICPECTGWCEIVYIDGKEWLKCRTCGDMRKVTKRIINLVKGTKK